MPSDVFCFLSLLHRADVSVSLPSPATAQQTAVQVRSERAAWRRTLPCQINCLRFFSSLHLKAFSSSDGPFRRSPCCSLNHTGKPAASGQQLGEGTGQALETGCFPRNYRITLPRSGCLCVFSKAGVNGNGGRRGWRGSPHFPLRDRAGRGAPCSSTGWPWPPRALTMPGPTPTKISALQPGSQWQGSDGAKPELCPSSSPTCTASTAPYTHSCAGSPLKVTSTPPCSVSGWHLSWL